MDKIKVRGNVKDKINSMDTDVRIINIMVMGKAMGMDHPIGKWNNADIH